MSLNKKLINIASKFLLKNGFYEFDFNFSHEATELIKFIIKRKYLASHTYHNKELKPLPMKDLANEYFMALPHDNNILRCPNLLGIMNDKRIIRIVEDYLGSECVISGWNIWWSNPKKNPSNLTQKFHRDPPIYDVKNVAVFIYLTDVKNKDDGPHVYIKKSHKKNIFIKEILIKQLFRIHQYLIRPKKCIKDLRAFVQGTYSHDGNEYPINKYINQYYKKKNIKFFFGMAGSIFMTIPCGLHMGEVPIEKSRCMMTIRYACKNKLRYRNEEYNTYRDKIYKILRKKVNNIFIRRNINVLKDI